MDDERPPGLPALSELPSSEWKAALTPLTMAERREALGYAPERAEVDRLLLLGELEFEDWERAAKLRAAAAAGTAIPVPEPASDARRGPPRSRQVNFRLDPELARRLDNAAGLLGLKSAALARMLTVNGVARILQEHRASLAE